MSGESTQRRWSAVSRHIIISLVLELIVVASALFWWGGLGIWLSTSLALGVIVAYRLVIAVLSFVVAWWFGSPVDGEYSLGVAKYLHMVLSEIAAFMKLFFFFHALEPLLNRHDADEQNGVADEVVLFVHGFFSNAGFWVPFKRYLSQRGMHALYTINLDPEFADIDVFADQLAARIENICRGGQKLVLVGHSMGGLVCRAYVDKYGVKFVRRVVTLGSPHHGTVLAYLLPGPNLAQMQPGSAWLSRLNEKTPEVPVSTHYSVHDNIVVPQNSARLEHAATFVLAGIGHLSMAFSQRIMASVLEDIRSNSQKT